MAVKEINKYYEAEFYPGELVKIKDAGINARVVSVEVNENGIIYNCKYWYNGDGKQWGFYRGEIESCEEKKDVKIGFVKK
jgi:uncharacterized protein YodC (DUF2158 family)